MNFEELDSSLVLLQPKQRFFDWLEGVLKKQNLKSHDVYFEEEGVACVVRSVGAFDSKAEFDSYLAELKPKLLIRALGGFITDPKEFPEISAQSFDEFFLVTTRDKLIAPVNSLSIQ